jgi:two-component system NarL family sensor kinase
MINSSENQNLEKVGKKPRRKRQNLTEKLEQRNRELSILKAITESLNRALDVKTALDNAVILVAELLELEAGWVWLLDEVSGEPYLAAARMLPPYLTAKPSRMRGKACWCLSTFVEGDLEGAAAVNILECSRLSGVVEGTNGLQYHASIPIYAHDKPLGVMNVASADWRRLSANDLELLTTIGYQIGIAVERARLFDQTTRLATAEERNRLAREIHDTIAQGMAATILNLESADIMLEDSDPARHKRAHEKVRKALNMTRANLEEVRRSVLDLRATPLQEKTLTEALALLVEDFQHENSTNNIEAHFELIAASTTNRRYPARVEAGVYRIVQEALTNIKKHAQAKTVRVSMVAELLQGKEQLRLEIKDDGRGFDLNQVEQASTKESTYNNNMHFGLIGMRERAKLLGGKLEIASYLGNGTQIELIVPLA